MAEDQVEQGPGNHVSEAHPGRYVDPNSGAAHQPGGQASGAELQAQAQTDAPVPQEDGANEAETTTSGEVEEQSSVREERVEEHQRKRGPRKKADEGDENKSE